MHRTHKLISFAAAALIIGGIAAPALARRQSAFSGIAQQPSQATCFSNGNGVITNNCSGPPRTFCVPLIYDWNAFGNWANVTVTALAPAGALMNCQTTAVGKQGQFGSWSGDVNVPMNGTWQDVVVNGGGIADGGAVYTCCNIPTGGSISVLNY